MEASDSIRLSRGRGLIRQVSSFFCSSSSRTSLEEDVFVPDPQDQTHEVDSSSSRSVDEPVSVALVQDCSSVPLPDLVSCQREQADSVSVEELDAGEPGRDAQERQEEQNEEKLKESCLRYYHVFREGELTRLIEEHVEDLHILHTCLDHANWCVVAEKVQVWRV